MAVSNWKVFLFIFIWHCYQKQNQRCKRHDAWLYNTWGDLELPSQSGSSAGCSHHRESGTAKETGLITSCVKQPQPGQGTPNSSPTLESNGTGQKLVHVTWQELKDSGGTEKEIAPWTGEVAAPFMSWNQRFVIKTTPLSLTCYILFY